MGCACYLNTRSSISEIAILFFSLTRRALMKAKLTALRSLFPDSPSVTEAETMRDFISETFGTFLQSAMNALE